MKIRLVKEYDQATRIGQRVIAERLAMRIGRAIECSLEVDPSNIALFGPQRVTKRAKDGYRIKGYRYIRLGGGGPWYVQIEGDVPKTLGECHGNEIQEV